MTDAYARRGSTLEWAINDRSPATYRAIFAEVAELVAGCMPGTHVRHLELVGGRLTIKLEEGD